MAEQIEQIENTEAKKPDRIVTLETGESENFGTRTNVKSVIDPVAGTITFKIITGQVFVHDLTNDMVNLTDDQRLVYMYGIQQRIKASLAGVGVEKSYDTISKVVELIRTRGLGIRLTEDDEELDIWQKAYALAISNPVFTPIFKPEKEHWKNIDDLAVIKEVLSEWEGLDKSARNAIRKSPFVQVVKGQLEISAGNVKGF